MAGRKSFLLRLDPETYEAVARWAGDDLRSVNGQLEFLIRRALADAGRLPGRQRPGSTVPTTAAPSSAANGEGR